MGGGLELVEGLDHVFEAGWWGGGGEGLAMGRGRGRWEEGGLMGGGGHTVDGVEGYGCHVCGAEGWCFAWREERLIELNGSGLELA